MTNTAQEILRDLSISLNSSASGRYYAICPKCSSKRKKGHQKLKCLGITIDGDGVRVGCNHCQWTGGGHYDAPGGFASARRKTVVEPAEPSPGIEESRKKALWLWKSRQPIADSIAETYLRQCRRYNGLLPGTLGFLPARGEHPPAMIAAFGTATETLPGEIIIYDAAVRGVHLTKLKLDGSGKAGTEADKITIGTGNKSPIMLAPPNDLLGLAISEGIEDALSIHEATGLGAWAAGSAGRMPAMADGVPDYIDCVTIAVDDDPEGEKHAAELARRLTDRGIETLMARLGRAA